MKKLMLSILAGLLTVTMALTSCQSEQNPDTDSSTDTDPVTSATEQETTSEEKPTSEEPTTEEPSDPNVPQINVGDKLFYNMAYFLDEAIPSNATEEDKHKFLQNISNDYVRIDDEFMVNEDDVYQLFWSPSSVGDTLIIPFAAPKAGTYSVKLSLHCGGDFGTFDVFFGDDLLTGSKGVDLFRSADGGLYDFEIGECVLEEGDNELIFRLKGRNDMSAGSVFGVSSMTLTYESDSTEPIERPDEPDTPDTPDERIILKAAFLLDAAKLANAGKNLFVQDTDTWARIDSVADLTETGNYQLFWGDIRVGDELKLTLNVEKAGIYDLTLLSNRGGDYGKFEVYVGNVRITDDYNLSGSGMGATSLTGVTLAAGENEVVFKCVSTNTAAETCVFAITSFTLTEAEPTVVKAAFLLDAAKTANEGKNLFVQDTNTWARIDSVADLTETGNYQLFWGDIRVGDELKLTLNVEKAGTYDLTLLSNRGGDYGKFEVYVGNAKITDDYNLSGSGMSATNLTGVTLAAGENEVVFKCVSTNTAAETCVFAITSFTLTAVAAAQ